MDGGAAAGGYHCSLTDGVHRSSRRNLTRSCPANALSFLGISPLSWLGRSPAVCPLPSPPRGVISPIFPHPCKQHLQQTGDCRAPGHSDSLIHCCSHCPAFPPSPATTDPNPLTFNYMCKAQLFPKAYLFFLFSFTVDCLRPW